MTSIPAWTYIHQCTIWRATPRGTDEPYLAPEVIMCDYGFDAKNSTDNRGNEIVQKNTFWTEYQNAKIGDWILLGVSTETDPLEAGADKILNVMNYGNTLEPAGLPDFALVTGV